MRGWGVGKAGKIKAGAPLLTKVYHIYYYYHHYYYYYCYTHIVAGYRTYPRYELGDPKRRIQGGTQSRVRSHDGRPRCRRPYAGARAHSLMVCPRLAMQTRPSDRRSISQILICLASPKVLRRDPRMVWRFDLLSSPSARDSIIIVISLERHRGGR